MERCGEDAAVLYKDGLAFVLRENGNTLPDFFDDRPANKNHFEWIFAEGARAEENVAGELAAVTIAENGHVEELQGILRRVLDLRGEENGARAGAENGVFPGEIADSVEEALFLEKLQLGGRFAAGQDEAVATIEIGDGAHLDGGCSEFAEASGVSFEITLNSKNTDFHERWVRLELVEIICS